MQAKKEFQQQCERLEANYEQLLQDIAKTQTAAGTRAYITKLVLLISDEKSELNQLRQNPSCSQDGELQQRYLSLHEKYQRTLFDLEMAENPSEEVVRNLETLLQARQELVGAGADAGGDPLVKNIQQAIKSQNSFITLNKTANTLEHSKEIRLDEARRVLEDIEILEVSLTKDMKNLKNWVSSLRTNTQTLVNKFATLTPLAEKLTQLEKYDAKTITIPELEECISACEEITKELTQGDFFSIGDSAKEELYKKSTALLKKLKENLEFRKQRDQEQLKNIRKRLDHLLYTPQGRDKLAIPTIEQINALLQDCEALATNKVEGSQPLLEEIQQLNRCVQAFEPAKQESKKIYDRFKNLKNTEEIQECIGTINKLKTDLSSRYSFSALVDLDTQLDDLSRRLSTLKTTFDQYETFLSEFDRLKKADDAKLEWVLTQLNALDEKLKAIKIDHPILTANIQSLGENIGKLKRKIEEARILQDELLVILNNKRQTGEDRHKRLLALKAKFQSHPKLLQEVETHIKIYLEITKLVTDLKQIGESKSETVEEINQQISACQKILKGIAELLSRQNLSSLDRKKINNLLIKTNTKLEELTRLNIVAAKRESLGKEAKIELDRLEAEFKQLDSSQQDEAKLALADLTQRITQCEAVMKHLAEINTTGLSKALTDRIKRLNQSVTQLLTKFTFIQKKKIQAYKEKLNDLTSEFDACIQDFEASDQIEEKLRELSKQSQALQESSKGWDFSERFAEVTKAIHWHLANINTIVNLNAMFAKQEAKERNLRSAKEIEVSLNQLNQMVELEEVLKGEKSLLWKRLSNAVPLIEKLEILKKHFVSYENCLEEFARLNDSLEKSPTEDQKIDYSRLKALDQQLDTIDCDHPQLVKARNELKQKLKDARKLVEFKQEFARILIKEPLGDACRKALSKLRDSVKDYKWIHYGIASCALLQEIAKKIALAEEFDLIVKNIRETEQEEQAKLDNLTEVNKYILRYRDIKSRLMGFTDRAKEDSRVLVLLNQKVEEALGRLLELHKSFASIENLTQECKAVQVPNSRYEALHEVGIEKLRQRRETLVRLSAASSEISSLHPIIQAQAKALQEECQKKAERLEACEKSITMRTRWYTPDDSRLPKPAAASISRLYEELEDKKQSASKKSSLLAPFARLFGSDKEDTSISRPSPSPSHTPEEAEAGVQGDCH